MIKILSTLCLIAPSAFAASKNAWIKKLTQAPLLFEMVNEENAGEFELKNSGILETFEGDEKSITVQKIARSLGEELHRIQKKYGRVVVDDFTFVQIAAIYKRGREKVSPVYLIPHNSLDFGYASYIHDTRFFNLGLRNDDAYTILRESPVAHKGQWLIAIDQKKYLGLSGMRAKVLTAPAWQTDSRQRLDRELAASRADYCAGFLKPPTPREIKNAEITKMLITLESRGYLKDFKMRSVYLSSAE